MESRSLKHALWQNTMEATGTVPHGEQVFQTYTLWQNTMEAMVQCHMEIRYSKHYSVVEYHVMAGRDTF